MHWHWPFLAAVLYGTPTVVAFMDLNLTIQFLKSKSISHGVVLTCTSAKERVKICKALQDKHVSVLNLDSLNILSALVDNYKRLGVVLDADCLEATQLLRKCGKYKVFDAKHHWLIQSTSWNFEHFFEKVNFNVDSEIKVAYPSSTTSYVMEDVYNPAYGKGGQVKRTKAGSYNRPKNVYSEKKPASKYFERKDFTGVTFNGYLVLSEPYKEPLEEYLTKDENIQVDSLNRFHARLVQYCKAYHNFSLQIKEVTNSWGYYKPDGTMDGLVGSLERKQTDFGISPLVLKLERTKFITFGKGTWHLRMAFILRNPNSKKAYEIFIRPLSSSVWICVIVLAIFSVLVQKLSLGLDRVVLHRVDDSWSMSALCTFGAFCQQGVNSLPHSLAGRMAVLSVLVLGLMVYQSYSAILVSFLLNVPVRLVNSVDDILSGNFGLGYERVLYSMSLLKARTDANAQEVYRRVSFKNGSGFMTRDQGMKLMKKGKFAFHVELATGYPFIEKNFDMSMICELREIHLFPPMYMYSGYQKWSPHKDFMDVCMQRLDEFGVINRELRYWHPKKPQCVHDPANIKIKTSLEDFYPALAILFFGIVISLQVLVMEKLRQLSSLQKRSK